MEFDYDKWESKDVFLEERWYDIYPLKVWERVYLNLGRLWLKLRRSLLKSWVNKSLGILQNPLPQKIVEVDMRFVDYLVPSKKSWQKRFLPSLVVGLMEDKIGQDEIMNYFFRIDTLWYDYL